MNIHEYQGKELLKKYGVPVLRGKVANSAEEAYTIAKEFGGVVVVKSQIHAGGRGKGGGVKVVKSPEEARDVAAKILGNLLVTHQTGVAGKIVKKVLIEEGCAIARELYLGATLDRAIGRVTLMFSAEGGVEIEEIAAKSPEKIFKIPVDPNTGVDENKVIEVATKLGLASVPSPYPLPRGEGGSHAGASGRVDLASKLVSFVKALYDAYVQSDCALAEINPLVVTKTGELVALDAKINFDDNALFRHPDYEALRDLDEEDSAEIIAKKYDLSYVSMDGNIGCMVNGAGLAMATMDIIKLHGGEPANFLDVGGGATVEKVTAAFKIILADPKVKAILVNIFGGIMRCDTIANGVVAAARDVQIKIPVVVRLQGTNVDLGKKILMDANLGLISEDNLAEAAKKVVAALT